MSLTSEDLQQIRTIVTDVVSSIVDDKINRAIKPLHDEIAAIRNDIKEIYDIVLV